MKDEKRRDQFLVSEMVAHSEVLATVVQKGRDSLESDRLDRYAAEHATELLAEAAEKVSHAFKKANPKVPWDRLRPLRREVAHPYDTGASGVVVERLWQFVTKDAPRISRQLRKARFPTTDEASE
ncbi:MAG: HepT-like ribonuclease domain-containing protein [Thermoplasmata archaeon]